MSSINDLLNHEQPASTDRRQSAASLSPTRPFDAVDALTALATLGSGQQYAAAAPTRDLPSPTAFSNAPRRTSSISSHHAPVAPSPTLEQYHHGSRSPEEQKRRQSLMSRSSPAPVLAPIQNSSSALHEQMQDESSSTPIGKSMSQIVPPPSRSSEGGEAERDVTQDREQSLGRDGLSTSQSRKAEDVKAESLSISQGNGARVPSPQPIIKNEPTGTPRESTPAIIATQPQRHNSITGEMLDAEALKALEVAKQADLGLRRKRLGSESVALPADPKPAPTNAKKRPAPSSASAPKKKGTAKAVKPSKKRKIDTEDDSNARSVTPSARPPKSATSKNIKKGSQAGTPALESSPAPDNSSQVAASDDDGESSEDHNLYCICKKPDNHKWMIGCDGGCDDWFHGDCVNMKQADEGLVDKFICPLCEENGRGHTTWKPMCRRDGCRRPARLIKENTSKYCSEECGTLFMTEQLQRTAGALKTTSTKDKSKKKKKPTDGAPAAEEEEPTPLGGTLRSKDLKALVDASPNIQTFRNLGTGVLSPPQTASPTRATFTSTSADAGLALTKGETERLTALHKEKSQLQDRLEVLKDREKFVSMAKEQALRVAEREKIKTKEFCGYDCRLSWSDAEFLLWRKTAHGKASFKFSTLGPSVEQIAGVGAVDGNSNGGTGGQEETVCLKKRCSKHPQWQKLNLQDARFEELEVVEAIRECEKEEKSVRERARRRGAKDGLAKELLVGEGGGVERNREGWVEAVGV